MSHDGRSSATAVEPMESAMCGEKVPKDEPAKGDEETEEAPSSRKGAQRRRSDRPDSGSHTEAGAGVVGASEEWEGSTGADGAGGRPRPALYEGCCHGRHGLSKRGRLHSVILLCKYIQVQIKYISIPYISYVHSV